MPAPGCTLCVHSCGKAAGVSRKSNPPSMLERHTAGAAAFLRHQSKFSFFCQSFPCQSTLWIFYLLTTPMLEIGLSFRMFYCTISLAEWETLGLAHLPVFPVSLWSSVESTRCCISCYKLFRLRKVRLYVQFPSFSHCFLWKDQQNSTTWAIALSSSNQ